MRVSLLATVVGLFVLGACASHTDEPTDEQTETSSEQGSELHVCPYLVPICEAPCKLEGGCPQKCVCPHH